MDDVELRQLKRSLRPGDQLKVTIHASEPGGGDKACLHVRSATVIALSVRSNTGIERTVVPEKRPGGNLPPTPLPPAARSAEDSQDLPPPTTGEPDEEERHDGANEAPHTERARVHAASPRGVAHGRGPRLTPRLH